jgi:hypothetical protein
MRFFIICFFIVYSFFSLLFSSSSSSRIKRISSSDKMPEHLYLHQRVSVGLSKNRTVIGMIRFLGHTLFAPGIWVGVELTTRDGKNNGSVQGHYYFQCPMNYGLFIREDLVVPLPNPVTPDQQPQQAVHPPNPPPPHAVSFAPSPASSASSTSVRPTSNSSSTHNRSHSHSNTTSSNNPIAAIRNEIKKTTSSETIKSNKTNNSSINNTNSNNKMNTSNHSSGKGVPEESSREKKENSATNNNSDLQKRLSSDNTVWSGISDTNFSYQSSDKSHSPLSPSKTTTAALKSSSVLKVKLSKMMELLNHQLELVEELEREEKKDIHSELVLNLRKHIHEVTEEEIEILSSFQMKFTEFPAEQR